jgi:hypothetical protein
MSGRLFVFAFLAIKVMISPILKSILRAELKRLGLAKFVQVVNYLATIP